MGVIVPTYHPTHPNDGIGNNYLGTNEMASIRSYSIDPNNNKILAQEFQ